MSVGETVNDKKFDIMVAGHLCIDIIPRFIDTGAAKLAELMRPGQLVEVDEATISTGGSVSNTGVNMHNLGNRVCYCARVGDDAFGRMTVDLLGKSGSTAGIHLARGATSSYTIWIAPPRIDRMFLHYPGTNDSFSSTDLDPQLIGECRHFHFGYPQVMRRMFQENGADLQTVFRLAKEAGATTSCDFTLPDLNTPGGQTDWQPILEQTLPYIDMLLPSFEELLYILDPDEYGKLKAKHGDAELIDIASPARCSDLADKVLSMGTKLIALKLGHRGIYLKSVSEELFAPLGVPAPGEIGNWSARELWAPALAIDEPMNTGGAGDVSIAGFLSAYLRGLSVETALKYATCCGWQSIQVLDAVSGVQSWEDTTALVQRGMATVDPVLAAETWQYNDSSRLWTGPSDGR